MAAPTIPRTWSPPGGDASRLPRGRLFGALIAVGLANGLAIRASDAIALHGFSEAVLGTFGISVLVWLAAFACVATACSAPIEERSRADVACAAAVAISICIPSDITLWLGLSGLGLYLLLSGASGPALRRAGTVLLALTVPCFWSKILFAVLSVPILAADALLVSAMLGTSRQGNLFETVDGNGAIWVAPGCSSLANVSLAVLCWTLVGQYRGGYSPDERHGSGRAGRGALPPIWLVLSVVAVVAINVGRMALVGADPALYEAVHGPVGGAVAGWLTLGAMVAICLTGARHGDGSRS